VQSVSENKKILKAGKRISFGVVFPLFVSSPNVDRFSVFPELYNIKTIQMVDGLRIVFLYSEE
jgi:hypothetical protein